MKPADTGDLWWKTAVYYCVDVKTFFDSDGDGIGDLAGVAGRIDYLAELGVTCLWLMPVYPSPGRDGGYDITDFYGIDRRLGTPGDLVEVLRTASDRGIRVIVDLVVNHTSDRHPWFVAARRSRTSRYRDYYVWTDKPPKDPPSPVFPGEEDSVWEYDAKTDQYYLHSFYRHQPDLNLANPEVRDEIAKVIGYWLSIGISGFRVDAVPFLLSQPLGADAGDPHDFLRDIKRFLERRRNQAMLLGEVNVPFREQLEYFGGGRRSGELDMQFDFNSMQALHLSLVRHDATPLVRALEARPAIPREAGWANFVRNHDELTLDKLTEAQRQEAFEALAPDESQRVYGRGIIRRLPTMLEGDPRRIRMAYSLLFSLPGAPVLYYGEEIGMGEDPEAPGRSAVRTPMQWTSDEKGGFSTAPMSRWPARFPAGGYGPRYVNAAAQRKDQGSLLQFMHRLVARYRVSPEIGWGDLEIQRQENPAVLVHGVRADMGRMIAVHNFADAAATARLELADEPDGTTLSSLFGPETIPVGDGVVEVDVEPYGWRWYRVSRPGDGRLA